MFKKSLSIVMLAGLLCGEALAQTVKSPTPNQPASLTITPTTLPEVLQVLDNTGTWVPMGLINTTKHSFIAVGGEADILVTDPDIGMAANNGQDNSPFVNALMNKQMPPSWGGYDVLFPSIPGQKATVYYFSEPFVNSRTGNYHCSGSVGYLSTYLVFAAGVDGFTQEIYTYTPDGGIGGGSISSCYILSLGFGGATADTANPTKLTSVGFQGNPGFGIPASVWHVGDGIILTNGGNAFFPPGSEFPVPVGTTITAVDGTTGDLTLSNPVSQSLGHVFLPKATAAFTFTGVNNFSEGDTIQVAEIIYHFTASAANIAGGVAGDHAVFIGATFEASANNLAAAVNGWYGSYVTYIPSRSGEDAFRANLLVSAAYESGVITFTSRYGPPDANTYPSIYTPTGTAAGSFGGATFSGANTSAAAGMAFYQLPLTQAFKIVTQPTEGIFYGYIVGNNLTITSMYSGTVAIGQPLGCGGATGCAYLSPGTIITGGSGTSWTVNNSQTVGDAANPVGIYAGGSYVAVNSGPRLLRGGDVIWSDAFPFGSTIDTVYGTVGNQTLHMTDAVNTSGNNPALVVHALGAEGNLWIMPAGLKRRTPANAKNNYFQQWPIGLQMSCSSNNAYTNCDLSRDEANNHDQDFVGRWVAGNNTATASSKDDQFSGNYLMDVWEGGTLGEIYYNLNTESPESANSKYGIIKNCANQNYTTLFGGYIGSGPGCSNGEFPYPPTYGGAVAFGMVGYTGNFGATYQVDRAIDNGFNFYGGPDGQQCVQISGQANAWSALMFSSNGCGIGTNLAMRWNGISNYWAWNMQFPGNEVMIFSNGGDIAEGGVDFPRGVVLGAWNNARNLNAGPTAQSPQIPGDMQINTAAKPGGNAFWYGTPNFTTTATTDFTGGSPNPLPVAACPPYTLPYIDTKIVDTTPTNPVMLGLYASCTGTSLTFFQIQGNNAKAGDTIVFVVNQPAAKVSYDPYGISYPVGTLAYISSIELYTPCNGDATIGLAVVADGQDAITAGYNAPVNPAATGSTRRLVFCDGTSWTYH